MTVPTASSPAKPPSKSCCALRRKRSPNARDLALIPMPVFAYRGLSANGRSVAGVIDADSARGARGKLRDLGIFPTDLGEEAASARGSGWSLRSLLPVFQRRIPATELAL